MKTAIRFFFLLVFTTGFLLGGTSQTKLLWDDQQDLISNIGETSLISKLADDEIEVVMSLDYKKRCEYVYAELTSGMNQATLTLYDCNRRIVGTKSWLSKFFGIPEEERVSLLAFAIIEILEARQSGDEAPREPAESAKPTEMEFNVPFNHHTTRYFFSPSSYNLQRGELYYNTLYFATHDFQYGVTDKFSIGMGTTLALLPFYVTPKFSHQISEKHAASIGSLFFVGTWGVNFIGNLAYGTYTYGNQFNNISLGLGHFYAGGQDIGDPVSELLVNLSGMVRMSDYIYFVSENYFLDFSQKHYLVDFSLPIPQEDVFYRTNSIIGGMSGFRFINKEKNVRAFQFGLTYVVRLQEPIPGKFIPPGGSLEISGWKRFVIPTISFVSKLGKRV